MPDNSQLPLPRLSAHAAAFFLCTINGTIAGQFIPLLVNLRFQSTATQSALITAAIPTFLMASIFWDQLFRRVSIGRYATLYWFSACLPLGLIALAGNFWHLLAFHVAAALGAAGWTPLAGALLKAFYPDRVRGRAYSLLAIASLASGALCVYFGGVWQSADPEAFRWFMPLTAVAQGLGLIVLTLVGRGVVPSPRPGPPLSWRMLAGPVLHMRAILAEDRVFARYEAAFMTYGFGFMFCEVLFPVYTTRALGLDYKEVAWSAFVVQKAVMALAVFPAGWVMDRLGPARTSTASFLMLSAYPLGLLAASFIRPPETGLLIANVFFGLAMAGVLHGWMLGPVALAPAPDRVSSYVAIHTTLVGFRGLIAQALGILLFTVSSGYALPFIAASLMLWWAAFQMWSLRHPIQERLRARTATAAPPGPESTPAFEPAVSGTPLASTAGGAGK